MRKTWTARLALAGAMAMALVGLMAAPAAADTNRVLSDSHGKFTFTDDGDMFEICDTKADGYGVIGRLVLRSSIDGSQEYVLILDDGGDAGCDKQGFNIGNFHYYKMEYWWEKDKGAYFQETGWFNE
jgi:hypothetical protein